MRTQVHSLRLIAAYTGGGFLAVLLFLVFYGFGTEVRIACKIAGVSAFIYTIVPTLAAFFFSSNNEE
jgi:hypothetical protein